MSITWNGQNRNKLRLALQEAYPEYDLLKIFVTENLEASLPEISANGALSVVVDKLLDWAVKNSSLDDLFAIFCDVNQSRSKNLHIELQLCPLISPLLKIPKEEWQQLFAIFGLEDFDYLKIAFREAFKAIDEQNLWHMCQDSISTKNSNEIQDLLQKSDNPILAVHFVDFVIRKFQGSTEFPNRDLTSLKQWRDQITERFQVPPLILTQVNTHVYLSVAIEQLSGSNVNVYPRLYITGRVESIKLDIQSCSIDEVASWISKWIQEAEEMAICENEEVTLEIFLPHQHLGEDIISTWIVENDDKKLISLASYRRFVVRSTDRIRKPSIQKAINKRWQELQELVQSNNHCDRFHPEKECREEPANLCALLKDSGALGLKLFTQLPPEKDKRDDLFYAITESPIPIALWSSEITVLDTCSLEAQFDYLLQCDVTNFAELARKWRMQRQLSASTKYIKLLCDCPDRLPKLPDKNRAGHALYADNL
jgi:hypothetical protein